jgi:TonB family protein
MSDAHHRFVSVIVAVLAATVVLVEVFVGPDGRILQMQVVSGASDFDQASLDAASRWSFRPARWHDRTVPAYVYLVFGFRQPT